MRKFLFLKWVAVSLMLFNLFAVAKDTVATLCTKDEKTLFTCRGPKGNKLYFVCASEKMSGNSRYIRYRAGTQGQVELEFPSSGVELSKAFQLKMLPRGIRLSFKNGGFEYLLTTGVEGWNSVEVMKKEKVVSKIQCGQLGDGDSDLMSSPVLDALKAAGIKEDGAR